MDADYDGTFSEMIFDTKTGWSDEGFKTDGISEAVCMVTAFGS